MPKMVKHALNNEIMADLQGGALKELLAWIQHDDTLDLQTRGDRFNIYYRGGSLFNVEPRKKGYKFTFKSEYCDNNFSGSKLNPNPPLSQVLTDIPLYKQEMDFWFYSHKKTEREFEQTLSWINNRKDGVSGKTDYYIADVEYPYFVEDDKHNKRFDFVAVKWLSNKDERKKTDNPSLVVGEMKFGDGSHKGSSGVLSHLEDLKHIVSHPDRWEALAADMALVFKQKCELGLMKDLESNQFEIEVSHQNPEVILLFAEHAPDEDKAFINMLKSINPNDYPFKILLAKASLMGYGLFDNCMEPLEDYIKRRG